MDSNIILAILLVISIIGKANSVSVATALLLLINLLHLKEYVLPFMDKNGTFLALVLLIATILIPIGDGRIGLFKIKDSLISMLGIIAFILSFLTTYLSGVGLKYLTIQGHADIMPSLILGSIAAAAFLGGVPVGPLITSGILALIIKIFGK